MEVTTNITIEHATHVTASEISQKLLTLIEDIKTLQDIAPSNIERVTGLKITFDPNNSNSYGVGGKINDTWFYNLWSMSSSLPQGVKPHQLMFSFDDDKDGNVDMTDVCEVDFNAYAQKMTNSGYTGKPIYGLRNRIDYWQFTRGDVNLQVYVRGESGEKVTHYCVSKLIINVKAA
jgi:hypothetical protein